MRADRLLSILLLLQTRGRMKAGDLADRLEVSERTIYRDLDALSAAGVPVYAERGPGGGCVLRPGYRTDLTALSDSEVASLFASTAGHLLDDLGFRPALQNALVKLEASLPGARRADAQQARSRLHIDLASWFGSPARTAELAKLRDALFADRRVDLVYRRADGSQSRRQVAPLGLVVKGGIWYLVASGGDAIRVFRASRIAKVVLTPERFERPARFDLAAFWAQWSRDLIAGIPQYRVTLRLSRSALPILREVFGDRGDEAIATGRRDRGYLRVEMTFDSLVAACGSLLGIAGVIDVVEPHELRRAIRERAVEVAQKYAR
jgi:predicted DNA-binding transcriptional regulator YafY